ncbi:alpha/beta hydrolase [Rhodobacteraceae bacterium D3-12]|nr:alpha/beta hydrolase [Rhodobacteraceae bacterium D3-12]
MTKQVDRSPDAPRRRPLHPALGLVALNVAARALSVVSPRLAGRWMVKMFTTPKRHKAPPRESDWMTGSRLERITGAGQEVPLYHWGGDGPIILLVHGFAGRGSQMGAFAAPLVAAGFHVVAMDLPAHGRAAGSHSAPPDMAKAIALAAAHLGSVFGVVAHSVGCLSTALAMSQGMRVAAVAFIAPPVSARGRLEAFARFVGFSPAALPFAHRILARRYGVGIETLETEEMVPGREVGVLILHDRADPMVPFEEGARLAEQWRGAALVATDGLGHTRILRDAEVTQQVVGFLSAKAAKAGAAPAA